MLLIDQRNGLEQMTDTAGNTMTAGSSGITHTSGKSITFTRDSLGRITQITDPAGSTLVDGYDVRGDLASSRDRELNETTYTYNSTHGLLTVKDPRGIQPVCNEYDAQGRLVRQIDAFGNAIVFSHDLNARREVVTDRLGRTTIYEYNARGQAVRITNSTGRRDHTHFR